MRKRLVFDCETNGLLDTVSRVHLIIMWDLDAEEMLVFREKDAAKAVKILQNADLLIGHNIIAYDLPMLEKLFPWFEPKGRIRDTLVVSRLVCANIKESDFNRFRKGTLPGKLIGRHSLESWGYRLGEYKGDFGKSSETDSDTDIWAEWSQEMEDYGIQDVNVTVKLWDYLCLQVEKQDYSIDAIKMEHQFADLVAKMERNGFCFDEEKAKVLYQHFLDRKNALTEELLKQFKPWFVGKWKKDKKPWTEDSAVVTIPTKTLNYKDPMKPSRTEGTPYCEVHLKEFNPGSRDAIADRLQRLFGWVPKEFTETGKPKVSEDILKDLVGELDAEEDGIEETEDQLYQKLVTRIPQAATLADYLMVVKRMSQLQDGKTGWLRLVRDGKIHGKVNSCGTRTGRVSHSAPNVSAVPRVGSMYGEECRSLWTVPKGFMLFGSDLSGIEIRCFANALSKYDDGAYGREVVQGDIHSLNATAFGVDSRNQAKTILYALLYGAGDAKLGDSIGKGGATQGRQIRNNFSRAVPAYGLLTKELVKIADRQGFIPSIDGRRVYLDSSHKALNTLLQSTATVIAKLWTIKFDENLRNRGLVHGFDGDYALCAWCHDELQVAFRCTNIDLELYEDTTDYSWVTGSDEKNIKKKIYSLKAARKKQWIIDNSPIAKILAEEVERAIKQVEEHFEMKVPLACEFVYGVDWSQTH